MAGRFARVSAVALILLGAGRASAQQAAPERRFDIGITARMLYDSNLLRFSPGRPVPPGQSASDVRLTPSVTLDLGLPVGRQSLFLNATAGKDFHKNNKELDGARASLAMGADLAAGSACTGRLRADYGRSQSDLADVLDKTELRNIENRLGFGTRLTCGRPVGLRAGAEYNYVRVRNSQERFFDIEDSEYTVRLSYARPTFGELALFGSYRDASPLDAVPGAAGANAFEVYSGGLRFEREIGARLGGAAEIGYSKLEAKRAGTSSFSGLSWAFNLRWRPIERLSSRILLSRDAEQSNLLNISYSVTTRARIDADYAVSRQLRLLGSAGMAHRRLRGERDGPGEPLADITQKVYDLTIGARLNANRNLYFTVDARRERRTGDDPLFNYRTTSVLVGVGSTI